MVVVVLSMACGIWRLDGISSAGAWGRRIMSFEDKVITGRVASPSPNAMMLESDQCRMTSVSSNMDHSQINGQENVVPGPVAIFWDIENCPVPSDVRPEDVAGNIRMALRQHPVVKGAVTVLSAYGDFNAFPRKLREGCQRTGVKLVDVPNGRKDAADKAILVDMFLFALDNRPPSSIMLISGDVDFAPALHILGQRGYTIVLAIPSSVTVSSALSSAGSFVWDWPNLARGEGIVAPKSVSRRPSDTSCYVNSGNVGQFLDVQNEEEAIVYTGTSRNEYGGRPTVNHMYCYNSSQVTRESKALYTVAEGNCAMSSKTPNLSGGLNDGPVAEQGLPDERSWWVCPGDLHGLKGQLIRLFELSGGCVPLVRIPSEYLKLFGRHLYVSEYGAVKLVHLFEKLADSFVVVGKGHKKMICLRNSSDRTLKNLPSTPIILKKEKRGGSAFEDSATGACQQLGSSSDDLSEDERHINPDIDGAYMFDDHLDSFRKEIQELLVCYSCPVLLGNFESLYEQRYKKTIDYDSFGVTGLEQLVEGERCRGFDTPWKTRTILQLWTNSTYFFLSSLNPKEYSRVAGIENARKIWKKLICGHEGVDVVKKSRLQVLKNQFNFFVMNKGEEPQQTHDRLMDIVNERRSYGDNIKDEEVNYKHLIALRMWNPTLCTIIEENDGFESFTTDELDNQERIIDRQEELLDEERSKNLELTKQLEQEKEKNKTLTKDLTKVNETSESCTSMTKKYQERCNSLQEENKALIKVIEDLKTSSRSLLKKLESSQVSTSKGCGRCHNIDDDMIAKQDAIIEKLTN
ncbi:hypothetical protein PR202_gb00007 [Eleusine coracana subsp. coracana]|uniref:HTH OST-type domain-containing protein n=1 Tax=Eleusine coracana subsp. coracana TaxID=191504 RepID=A0AAV5DTS3_ELECO|nr:hypothetical protein PR202_gb00007 [Eleusine coracana subsp. coracana]